jgi:AcrR family transcriptional regulator
MAKVSSFSNPKERVIMSVARAPRKSALDDGERNGRDRDKENIVKLSRAERNLVTKRRLFDAARKVVGRYGYAEASVARITSEAGVAQGTFYNHFRNRQELLDELLPTIGQDMLRFIQKRTRSDSNEMEKESDRFRGFFDFLLEVPEFLQILNQAEFFAPKGYQAHFDNVANAYSRLLRRARDANEISSFSDPEIDALVHMFLGARAYLSRHYVYSKKGVRAIPEHVTSAYEKLLLEGLFNNPASRSTNEDPRAHDN